jgi:glyoxylase-like metal-dependent hydrolase (beta-lactamase superfamily II)/8-oxo-dGTP pyrophosphatase MutT (NUDIX family)
MGVTRPAAAVMLCRDRRLWLGRRGNTRFLPGFSVFAGGTCEKGESTLTAARRELTEETGIELPEELVLIPFARAVTPAYSKLRYDVEVFMVELPPHIEPEPDGQEFSTGAWYTGPELLQARAAGEVQLAPPTYRQILLWMECQEGRRDWPDTQVAFAQPPPRNEQILPFAPGVTVIPLRTRAMPPAAWTNSVLVGEKSLYIIDPGGPNVESLLSEIADRTAAGAEVKGIILSHHHPDHLDGYHSLEIGNVPLYCHPITKPLLPKDFPRTRDLNDGDVLPVEDDLTMVCHFTPGHAPGHLAFELLQRKAILAGDMVSSLSSIVLPSDNGSLPDYLASLEKLKKREANLIIPSHGPPWGYGSDPFGQTIQHRQKREEQVLALLSQDPRSVESIAGRLYRILDPRLVVAARANVSHHLRKLASDGKAIQTEDGWALTEQE